MKKTVFVALGGNLGNSVEIIKQALISISTLAIENMQRSRLYLTTPVGGIPQNPFFNAVCKFDTTLEASALLKELQRIEKTLGKNTVIKNGPRTIDLDILFFGDETHDDQELTIPHPRWKERLFVLVPLSDLTSDIKKTSISDLLHNFSNPHNEIVLLWKE